MTLFAPDDDIRVSSHASRIARTRDAMRAADIELLIAYGSGQHSFLAMSPVWWLTGFKQMGPHSAVVLPIDSEPVVVVTPCWDEERATERSTLPVRACTPDAFLKTLSDIIESRGLASAKATMVGGKQMPPDICKAWAALLRQPSESGDKMLSDLARVRDEWSLECTRKAVRLAERGYDRLLASARPGMREHVVAADLEVFLRELGAEDNFQFLSASQHNRSVHCPTDRFLEKGDVLLAEITPAVEGEFAQICRTAVFGVPSEVQREKFAMLDEALRAGMRAAKPGVPVCDVVAAINAPIAQAGYVEYTLPPYMRTRGHSMGLGSMDPELAFDNTSPMVKGSVFVMHPNQYIPETGYFMCGEPVIITDQGAVPLTSRMGELGSIDLAEQAFQ